VAADDLSIPDVLLESLRDRLRAPRGGSAIELAVWAAVEPDVEQRAWALVALAQRLRRERASLLGCLAVDAAIALDAGVAPTRAARTVSVSLLADEGHLQAAVALGEQLLTEARDTSLLKVLARVYWELWQETGQDDWHERWWQVSVLRHGASRGEGEGEGEASVAPTADR
jgi:hypothetical protein